MDLAGLWGSKLIQRFRSYGDGSGPEPKKGTFKIVIWPTLHNTYIGYTVGT